MCLWSSVLLWGVFLANWSARSLTQVMANLWLACHKGLRVSLGAQCLVVSMYFRSVLLCRFKHWTPLILRLCHSHPVAFQSSEHQHPWANGERRSGFVVQVWSSSACPHPRATSWLPDSSILVAEDSGKCSLSLRDGQVQVPYNWKRSTCLQGTASIVSWTVKIQKLCKSQCCHFSNKKMKLGSSLTVIFHWKNNQ